MYYYEKWYTCDIKFRASEENCKENLFKSNDKATNSYCYTLLHMDN